MKCLTNKRWYVYVMASAELPKIILCTLVLYGLSARTHGWLGDWDEVYSNVWNRKTSNHKSWRRRLTHWFPSGSCPRTSPPKRFPLTVLCFPCTIILLGNECSAQSFGDWITLWSYTCTLPKCRKTATFSLVVFQWSNCYHLFAFELASDHNPRTK